MISLKRIPPKYDLCRAFGKTKVETKTRNQFKKFWLQVIITVNTRFCIFIHIERFICLESLYFKHQTFLCLTSNVIERKTKGLTNAFAGNAYKWLCRTLFQKQCPWRLDPFSLLLGETKQITIQYAPASIFLRRRWNRRPVWRIAIIGLNIPAFISHC